MHQGQEQHFRWQEWKIYLEEDLKDIPEEYYIDIIECLESLKNGFTENNEIKGKSLKNNARLKGLHEIKKFKIRIGYLNLDSNLTFIIFCPLYINC